MSQELEHSAKQIKSAAINLDDIEELKSIKLTDGENNQRAADSDVFYTKHFEKKIKLMLQKQMEKMMEEAVTEYDLQFCRGVYRGFQLVNKWFEKQKKISRSQGDKTEDLDLTEL